MCRFRPAFESQTRHQVRGPPTCPTNRARGLQLALRLGHYHKALSEDAINGKDFKSQWPREWNDRSPLAGGATFQSISPEERVRDRLSQCLHPPPLFFCTRLSY
jgi:hypothetical protein